MLDRFRYVFIGSIEDTVKWFCDLNNLRVSVIYGVPFFKLGYMIYLLQGVL